MSQNQVEEKDETTTLLRKLREECAQIYELSVEEEGMIKQLCEMLSEVQSFFKIGVNLPTSLFPFKEEIQQATLSISGDIVLIKKDAIDSQHLSKLDSPTVVAVLKEAAYRINIHAKKHREALMDRIALLEKLTRELKKLHDLKKLQEEDLAPDQYLTPEVSTEELERSS